MGCGAITGVVEMMPSKLSAVLFACLMLLLSGVLAKAEPIQGSGSTFAFPFLSNMSREYLEHLNDGGDYVSNDNAIGYEPVGSLGGILRLADPEIDFAATDFPLSSNELKKSGYIQFPIVIGGIVPVINVKAIGTSTVNLPADVLANIYLGKTQNWNDPSIAKANPTLKLPDLKITVVHRSDGSGSTYNWTQYLSESSSEWQEKYGVNTLVSWPLGTSVKGGGEMAAKVSATDGAIGYLEFGQANRAKLTVALVANSSGQFVTPDAVSMLAAADSAAWSSQNDFFASMVKADNPAAYPITAATFIVMRKDASFGSSAGQAIRFFRYVLEKGGKKALELGYVPVPARTVEEVKKYWTAQLGS
jgi:phosphate transport system substrate-binding protein